MSKLFTTAAAPICLVCTPCSRAFQLNILLGHMSCVRNSRVEIDTQSFKSGEHTNVHASWTTADFQNHALTMLIFDTWV